MKDLLERGPGEAFWVTPSVLDDVFARDNVPEALAVISPARADLERLADEQTSLDAERQAAASRRDRGARRPATSC